MHTLTIAKNFETAESVTRFYALRELPKQEIRVSPGGFISHPNLQANGYDWGDPYALIVALRAGRRYQRIIICNDWIGPGPYTQWRGLAAGEWVIFWDLLQEAVAGGTQRVWS